jgi:hypothetical protein
LGCAAILLRISTILRYRKAIHFEGMYFTGSVRIHILACADFRFSPIPLKKSAMRVARRRQVVFDDPDHLGRWPRPR